MLRFNAAWREADPHYLGTLPYKPGPQMPEGHFYMVNNLSPGFLPNGTIDTANITAAKRTAVRLRTIGDALNDKRLHGRITAAATMRRCESPTVHDHRPGDRAELLRYLQFRVVCLVNNGQPEAAGHTHQGCHRLFQRSQVGRLPEVSIVKPDSFVDGHPASSKVDLFEAMLENIVDRIKQERYAYLSHSTRAAAIGIRLHSAAGLLRRGPRIPFIVFEVLEARRSGTHLR